MADGFVLWQQELFRVVAKPKTVCNSRTLADWTLSFESADGKDALGVQRWREPIQAQHRAEVVHAVALVYLQQLLKEHV